MLREKWVLLHSPTGWSGMRLPQTIQLVRESAGTPDIWYNIPFKGEVWQKLPTK